MAAPLARDRRYGKHSFLGPLKDEPCGVLVRLRCDRVIYGAPAPYLEISRPCVYREGFAFKEPQTLGAADAEFSRGRPLGTGALVTLESQACPTRCPYTIQRNPGGRHIWNALSPPIPVDWLSATFPSAARGPESCRSMVLIRLALVGRAQYPLPQYLY